MKSILVMNLQISEIQRSLGMQKNDPYEKSFTKVSLYGLNRLTWVSIFLNTMYVKVSIAAN